MRSLVLSAGLWLGLTPSAADARSYRVQPPACPEPADAPPYTAPPEIAASPVAVPADPAGPVLLDIPLDGSADGALFRRFVFDVRPTSAASVDPSAKVCPP